MAPNDNGNGARGAKWTALAAIVVAVVGNVTVSYDSRQNRNGQQTQNNQFFRSQCARDQIRDQVFSSLLEASRDRIADSPLPTDPVEREERAKSLSILQNSIDQIHLFEGWCRASIPD